MEHNCYRRSKMGYDSEWSCYIDNETNELYVHANSEYVIDVKYCPFCGFSIEQTKEDV